VLTHSVCTIGLHQTSREKYIYNSYSSRNLSLSLSLSRSIYAKNRPMAQAILPLAASSLELLLSNIFYIAFMNQKHHSLTVTRYRYINCCYSYQQQGFTVARSIELTLHFKIQICKYKLLSLFRDSLCDMRSSPHKLLPFAMLPYKLYIGQQTDHQPQYSLNKSISNLQGPGHVWFKAESIC